MFGSEGEVRERASPSTAPAPPDPAGACLLRVEDLHKSFGATEVLKGVNLDVQLGQTVTLIGPSGSGKTTLLRCVNYLERPTAGHVWIQGRLIGEQLVGGHYRAVSDRELARERTEIGMVFQRFNLFPHLTALENITLGPRFVLKQPRAAAEELARELLHKVGLAHKADEYPERLSGGQQQRVAIARALAMQPKLLLFDEPTSSLDPELIGEVLGVMRQLAHEGRTMLVVTHEMQFASDVSERVVFMEHGEIIEDSSPSEMFSNPRHPRIRTFLRQVLER